MNKLNPVRDRRYLDFLRTQRCIITGQFATDTMAVDPAHIGTLGKGIKSSDDEVLPLIHYLHLEGHNTGEMTMWRNHMHDSLLRAVLRAYARERRQLYLDGKL